MKPYKISDAILKNIQKEFQKALKKYKSTNTTFQFNYTPKLSSTKRIKIYCLPTAWCKIITLVQKTETEIAWHMLIEKVSKTQYIITDILVYPQTVTGATVNTDDTKYALWVNSIPDKEFETMKGQGHSHVNMGVSPSSVDTSYYTSLLQTMQKGFYLFMITNKKGDMFLQLIDIDNNTIYENTDIIFEIASKQWYQNKWYTEMMKNIKHTASFSSTFNKSTDREYHGYGYNPNNNTNDNSHVESKLEKGTSKFTEIVGDDWYDRFM